MRIFKDPAESSHSIVYHEALRHIEALATVDSRERCRGCNVHGHLLIIVEWKPRNEGAAQDPCSNFKRR